MNFGGHTIVVQAAFLQAEYLLVCPFVARPFPSKKDKGGLLVGGCCGSAPWSEPQYGLDWIGMDWVRWMDG